MLSVFCFLFPLALRILNFFLFTIISYIRYPQMTPRLRSSAPLSHPVYIARLSKLNHIYQNLHLEN